MQHMIGKNSAFNTDMKDLLRVDDGYAELGLFNHKSTLIKVKER